MCLEIYDVSREIGFMQADPLFKFVRGMDSILVLVDEWPLKIVIVLLLICIQSHLDNYDQYRLTEYCPNNNE